MIRVVGPVRQTRPTCEHCDNPIDESEYYLVLESSYPNLVANSPIHITCYRDLKKAEG